ncbi:MAG TPA: OPT family oligopeptide transporter [Polyangia bacterium]|jgi:uncharacterized oligopeptide transporter (OPT) family protein
MAALPFRFTGDESLLTEIPAPAVVPAAPHELTFRAVAAGCLIGALLAAGNVYTALKTGFIDTGALTATLVSFAVFASLRRFGARAFTRLENNVAQTVAASAAVMGFVHGLMGPIPALQLMGLQHPAWALWTWGLALGIIGIVIGAWSRQRLIVDEALPFPSGIATAELLKTLHVDRGSAARPMRLLLLTAALAALLTWARDGASAFIPQAVYLPLAIGGIAASTLTLGIAVSPLMTATGIFVGLRGAVSLFGASVLAWAALAPLIVVTHIVKDPSYAALVSWLVWPAFGMMLGASVGPLVAGARRHGQVVLRALGDVRVALARVGKARSPGVAGGRGRALVAAVTLGAVALLVWTGHHAFGLSVFSTVVAVALSIVLAGVCARAAGETDIAPVGNMGTLGQIAFAGGGPATSILAGAVVAGNATQTAQSMWSFKAGHALRASVRAQFVAQLVGVLLGSVVVVPTYLFVIGANPLGTERMPAVAAISWRATAQAVSGGLAGLPAHGLQAALAGFAVGLVLSILGRGRWGRFLPSPVAMGIGLITPVTMSAPILLGAGAIALGRRRWPSLANGDDHALAAGALAGESLMGVLLAILAGMGMHP